MTREHELDSVPEHTQRKKNKKDVLTYAVPTYAYSTVLYCTAQPFRSDGELRSSDSELHILHGLPVRAMGGLQVYQVCAVGGPQ